MKYLYLLLNFGSFLIPFIFSFHPRLKFYRYWKPLFLGIIFSMLVFIPWDVFFTLNGIWGFNENYSLGIKILSLPLEEWLFFLCIPYACVFTHYALLQLSTRITLTEKITNRITYIFIAVFILIVFINYNKWYTFINFLYAAMLLIIVKKYSFEILKSYFLTFLVMLIPFFFINGILTGSHIENEVVWYNNNENLNFRIFTIPIEDTVYSFSLILTNIVFTRIFYKKMN